MITFKLVKTYTIKAVLINLPTNSYRKMTYLHPILFQKSGKNRVFLF